MPRKGENIYKRKDGRWEGRYIKSRSDTGKAIYGYVYAHSYREVKSKLMFSIQTTVTNHPISAKPELPKQTNTFGDFADLWMKSIKPQVKESTYRKYYNSLKNYVLPMLENEHLAEISYSTLEQFASSLLVSGGQKKEGLSPKTVTDIMSMVRLIMRYANKNGIDTGYSGTGINVKQELKELIILTTSEQEQLQQYLCDNLTDRNLGVLICLYTGMRIGEICALKWEDISLDDKHIKIHHTMQRLQCENHSTKTKIVITTPKSKCSIRAIPLPDVLVDLMKENFCNSSGYVLTGRNEKFIEPRTMQNHFKRVLAECKIREVNYHTLRHTFATRCVELGFDVKSLSEILGHASVNITMNRYVHPSMELKRENMNKLTELFSVK